MSALTDALKHLDDNLPRPYGLLVHVNGDRVPLDELEIAEHGEFVVLSRPACPKTFSARLIARNLLDLSLSSGWREDRETPEHRQQKADIASYRSLGVKPLSLHALPSPSVSTLAGGQPASAKTQGIYLA